MKDNRRTEDEYWQNNGTDVPNVTLENNRSRWLESAVYGLNTPIVLQASAAWNRLPRLVWTN